MKKYIYSNEKKPKIPSETTNSVVEVNILNVTVTDPRECASAHLLFQENRPRKKLKIHVSSSPYLVSGCAIVLRNKLFKILDCRICALFE